MSSHPPAGKSENTTEGMDSTVFSTLDTHQIVNYILFHLQRPWGKRVVSGQQYTGEKHLEEACYKYAGVLKVK